MKLIVGLGNPGKQYEKTRHNAGFVILDEIQKELSFPEFQLSKKFEAQVSEGHSNFLLLSGEGAPIAIGADEGERIILAKPQTFMNKSGQSIQAIMTFYKIPLEDVTIVHDDLDIALGSFKVATDSSAAGHNGVTSIFETLGTQKMKRIRIGIEGAEKKLERQMSGSDFVLQTFSDEELAEIKKLSQEVLKNS